MKGFITKAQNTFLMRDNILSLSSLSHTEQEVSSWKQIVSSPLCRFNIVIPIQHQIYHQLCQHVRVKSPYLKGKIADSDTNTHICLHLYVTFIHTHKHALSVITIIHISYIPSSPLYHLGGGANCTELYILLWPTLTHLTINSLNTLLWADPLLSSKKHLKDATMSHDVI